MTGTRSHDTTEETRAVLARRADVVDRMFAGEASYEDVLTFHTEDFVWLSPAGARVGIDEARQLQAQRMARLPSGALAGFRVLRHDVVGQYAFVLFKTDTMPFGTDTYRVVDGKVVFQSNALYLPQRFRPGASSSGGAGETPSGGNP